MTCVWAFKPLAELKNQTGFVECDDELAARLIASGAVQNPQVGANLLRAIDNTPPPPPPPAPAKREAVDLDEYDTKVVTPKKSRGK